MNESIEEGNHVVALRSFDSGNMKIIHVKRDTMVYYGKLRFDPSPLIGSKFGSVFEIKDNKMIPVDDFEVFDCELSETVSNKLTTFSEKSQFSKEKIIKKKKKQSYANIVTIVRPSLMLVNEMLYARDKIGGLRSDTLSQIITSSNIQNGSKCLLMDHNLGLLTSALMSRILPDGICIQLIIDHEIAHTTRNTLSMLNITEKDCAGKLLAITVRDVYKVSVGIDSFSYENEVLRMRSREHLERVSQLTCGTGQNSEIDGKIEDINDPGKNDLQQVLIKKDANRESRNGERLQAASHLKSKSLDSIILIAQNDHPLQLLKLTYPFLLPSRQIVIYCDTVEPLLECHQYLKLNSLAVALNLSESWLRNYQVLPDRTRPEMTRSGYGGYLLSATKALYGQQYGNKVDEV